MSEIKDSRVGDTGSVVENLILEYDEDESEEQEEMELRGILPALVPKLRTWFNALVVSSQVSASM